MTGLGIIRAIRGARHTWWAVHETAQHVSDRVRQRTVSGARHLSFAQARELLASCTCIEELAVNGISYQWRDDSGVFIAGAVTLEGDDGPVSVLGSVFDGDEGAALRETYRTLHAASAR